MYLYPSGISIKSYFESVVKLRHIGYHRKFVGNLKLLILLCFCWKTQLYCTLVKQQKYKKLLFQVRFTFEATDMLHNTITLYQWIHIGKTSSNLTLHHILWVEETRDAKFFFSELVSQSVVLKHIFWPGLQIKNSQKDIVLKKSATKNLILNRGILHLRGRRGLTLVREANISQKR